MNKTVDILPIGALPKYVIAPGTTLVYIGADKEIVSIQVDDLTIFLCPLLEVNDKETEVELERKLREVDKLEALCIVNAGGDKRGFFGSI